MESYYIYKGGRGNGKSASLEFMKNLKHLEILIKQSHKEVEELGADITGECPVVYIYYREDKDTIIYSKLYFSYKDDPLNLYRRILDDIIERSFVANNSLV